MSKEIFNLADECFVDRRNNKLPTFTFMGTDDEVIAFYRAAFNAGLERAAAECLRGDNEYNNGIECAAAIRGLKEGLWK